MADLRSQRALASRILKAGRSRIWFDPARSGDIEDAITSADLRRLISEGAIAAAPVQGISSYRHKKRAKQKQKGRRRGPGSRKGARGARASRKRQWVKRIRVIRAALRSLRKEGRIEVRDYKSVYRIAKSGFFRNRAHLTQHLEKSGMLKEAKK